MRLYFKFSLACCFIGAYYVRTLRRLYLAPVPGCLFVIQYQQRCPKCGSPLYEIVCGVADTETGRMESEAESLTCDGCNFTTPVFPH